MLSQKVTYSALNQLESENTTFPATKHELNTLLELQSKSPGTYMNRWFQSESSSRNMVHAGVPSLNICVSVTWSRPLARRELELSLMWSVFRGRGQRATKHRLISGLQCRGFVPESFTPLLWRSDGGVLSVWSTLQEITPLHPCPVESSELQCCKQDGWKEQTPLLRTCAQRWSRTLEQNDLVHDVQRSILPSNRF